MTNEQILEMVSLRLNGASVGEIKEKTGASDKDIEDYMPRALAAKNADRGTSKIVYPAIRGWMIRHKHSMTDVAKIAGIPYSTFLSVLYGKFAAKENIDKILAATGLTYEQAFKREV